MSTKNQTVAISLHGGFFNRKKLDENFRVYFWFNTYNYNNATESITVQAVKCVDMYAEEIAQELIDDPSGQSGFFTQEFQNTPGYVWICPNTTHINVLNDLAPAALTYVNFQIDVLQCQMAQEYDEDAGIVSYADKDEKLTCKSGNETAEHASKYSVSQKLISMYFSPSDYHEYGEMLRTVDYEQTFPLSDTGYINTKYQATRDQVKFYDNFFLINDYALIDDYSYVQLLTMNEGRILETMPFFTLIIGQGQLRTNTTCYSKNFVAFLTKLGGLFTSMLAIATFIVQGYQRFVKQKSMLKKLYGEEKKKSGDVRMASKHDSPIQILQEKMSRRTEFRVRYCTFLLVSCF